MHVNSQLILYLFHCSLKDCCDPSQRASENAHAQIFKNVGQLVFRNGPCKKRPKADQLIVRKCESDVYVCKFVQGERNEKYLHQNLTKSEQMNSFRSFYQENLEANLSSVMI